MKVNSYNHVNSDNFKSGLDRAPGDGRCAWAGLHRLILLVCLFSACASWVRAERATLTYGAAGKSLSRPRVLERTADSVRIVHDTGVGTFYRHEFGTEDWRWIQDCEIGAFQTRAAPAPAQTSGEPSSLGWAGKYVFEGLKGTQAGWVCAVGFLFAVLCRLLLVRRLVWFAGRPGHVAAAVGPASGMLAAVEQVVYTGALVGGWAWFVAVWMIVRTAAERDLWLKRADAAGLGLRIRLHFLETGLSLLVAAVGARLARGDTAGFFTGWVLSLVTLAGFVVLFLWVWLAMRRVGDAP